MKESIVLYPAPRFNHMVSVVELGKLILQNYPDLSVTVLVPAMPFDTFQASSYASRMSQTHLPISFFSLPSDHVTQPDQKASGAIIDVSEAIRLNVPKVIQALETLSLTSKVLCLITSAVNASYHPTIPTYYNFTSGASALALLLHFPTLHKQTSTSFKDLKDSTLFHIPGLPPIKPSYMLEPLLDRNHPAYHEFHKLFSAYVPNSKGIIVNTFDFLEPRAIEAIRNGACTPTAASVTPPIYCVGPLIVDSKNRAGGALDDAMPSEYLAWLDAQPSRSVIFLCFGSRGAFSAPQLKEIAIGLERSEQRFLWVVRNPPPNSHTEPNLNELLPNGFLERTKEKGLVLKCWAPQAAILSHDSIGGFVTHCGWNSVLEAVSHGVPMVAWPLYAEQKVNSLVLVEEMKVAMPVSSGKEGMVSAEEVESRARELMGSKGKALRKRSLEVKEMGKEAWSINGGSSFTAFSKLVASWKQDYSSKSRG